MLDFSPVLLPLKTPWKDSALQCLLSLTREREDDVQGKELGSEAPACGKHAVRNRKFRVPSATYQGCEQAAQSYVEVGQPKCLALLSALSISPLVKAHLQIMSAFSPAMSWPLSTCLQLRAPNSAACEGQNQSSDSEFAEKPVCF